MKKYSLGAVLLAALLLIAAGCSQQSPVGPTPAGNTNLETIAATDSCYDLAFRDTIVAIDYATGQITVAQRPEIMLIDGNTLIWGNIIDRRVVFGDRLFEDYMMAVPSAEGPGHLTVRRDTLLELTDLTPGDIIEVRADVVDAATLLALKIKLTNCGTFTGRCVEFEAPLATIDVGTRTVTFGGFTWNGIVCDGAELTDVGGEPLTLGDFAPGDLVAVKGFPLEEETLRICLMHKL